MMKIVASVAAAGIAVWVGLSVPQMGGEQGEGGTGYTVPAALGRLDIAKARPEIADFTFLDGSGAPRSLSAYRGRVLLVNMWATWCAPCVKEMPTLDALQQKLGGGRFEVLAISQDRGGAEVVRKFYEQQGLKNLKVYVDKGNKAGRALKVQGLPTTVLIDAQGREAGRAIGAVEWDDPKVVEAIRKVIEGE